MSKPGPFEDVLPLTPMQEGMLFHALFDDALDVYTLRLAIDIEGAFELPVFRRSVEALLRRHANLRAGFRHAGLPQPVQLIPRQTTVPVREIDFSGLPECEAADRLADLAEEEARTTFDLTRPPLLRFTVVRLGAERHRIALNCHHILLDGWSMPVLLGELFRLYNQGGSDAGLPPVPPFRTFLAWLKGQDRSAGLAAWRKGLAGVEGPTRLAPPGTGPTDMLPNEHRRELTDELSAGLQVVARRHSVTLSTIVQAAWGVVLAGLTGQHDVVFGTTVSGRPAEIDGVETMVGLFINTVPVRVRLDPAETLSALLGRMRDDHVEVLPHQHLPLVDIQRAIGQVGELFDTLVVFENYPLDAGAMRGAMSHLRVTGITAGDATHYPVLLNAGQGERVWLKLSYRSDLYDADRAARLTDRVVRVLEAVAADVDRLVGRVDVLSAQERHELLVLRNPAAEPVPTDSMVTMFEAQAARSPQATAVTAGDSRATYLELNTAANRLARLLVERGVGPETFVAISMRPSVDVVVALLAVLKTGAAYLPIDAGLPAQRIAFMLTDTAPALLLVDGDTRVTLPDLELPVIVVDDEETQSRLAAWSGENLTDGDRRRPLRLGHPAYVIYTSGSTGRPKGVVVEHRSVADYLAHSTRAYPAMAGVAVLHSPISFDLTVTALFTPLMVGGQVRLASLREAAPADAAGLADQPCTVLKATPSHLPLLTALPDQYSPAQELLLGGEQLNGEALGAWRVNHPDAQVYNVYGPTEATVNCAEYRIDPGMPVPPGPVPIGRPQRNARLYVLDPSLAPTLPGVIGDLYIAGGGLARGYLNRPALTADRFVADPFGPAGERMYRTGDLARWNDAGDLIFVGRADHQVKVRGFRIELGEIETILHEAPEVRDTAVIVREDQPGDQRLVAYVVPGNESVRPDELRDLLGHRLPEYMVPSVLMLIDALPLTPNGKLDRDALPAPEFNGTGGGRLPRTPQEEILCGLFAEVLGVGTVNVDDSFFDLGGHSLLATRLVSRIRSTLGVDLPIRALFEASTVARLSARLTGAVEARKAMSAVQRPERIPLSFAQRRLWFLNRFDGPSAAYNVPIAVRLTGALDHAAVEAALGDVSARHEILRTVFPDSDGEPYQVILPPERARPVLPVVEVAETELAAVLDAEARQGFDLADETAIRCRLYVLGPQEHVLLVVLHHIVSDAWSRRPFAADLGHAYRARCLNQEPIWAPLPVQYADFAIWQREVLGEEDDPGSPAARQVEFWRTALGGAPEELSLPTDRARPMAASHRGDTVERHLDAGLHSVLAALARSTGASLFMVLQAGVATLLHRLGAGPDIPLGTPIAGRTDDALDNLVGFFLNTLVLRTDLSGDPTFRDLIGRVRETDLAAYANQDLPFERLVEVLRPGRSLARHPLFQVMVTLQNTGEASLGVPGLEVGRQDTRLGAAKFDLLFSFHERHHTDGTAAGIDAVLEYSCDLFDRSTAEGLADRLLRLLTVAVADPAVPVSRLDILDRAERRSVLTEWNDTAHPVPARTLPELFERQAAAQPDAPAVVFDDAMLSFAELNARANRLARHLIVGGVGPEQVVALALPRSLDLVVALVATLKAGAAYLPIDLDYPADRVTFMLRDARPAAVLSSAAAPSELLGAVARPVLLDRIDLSSYEDTDVLDTDRIVPLSTAHPAYVIYTSGSTGRPKGVTMPGGPLVNLMAWHAAALGAPAGSRTAQFTAISFDVSAQEILGSLLGGGCLVVPRDEVRRDPEAFVNWLATYEVNELFAPNLVLEAVCEAAEAAGQDLPALEHLAQAGEALVPGTHLTAFAHRRRRRMHNHYGPTETHVVTATELPCSVSDWPMPVPIGRPIWNTRAYVVDDRLQPVPPGVAGELYVAGDQLARGYLHRPALTAERFIANPFASSDRPGDRLYRTGDLVRWLSDGQLEYLGRTDHQVKVRGFRVELGEIETALRRHPDVAQAAVLARTGSAAGVTQLVAYLVPVAEAVPDFAVMRRHLADGLPDYMIPAAFVVLDQLPLTPNGKLDRRRLPEPQGTAEAGRAPRTVTEAILCRLFTETLGVPAASVDDDFFALGGHSLSATRLASRIRATLGVELPIKAVFRTPTVAGLAVELAGAASGRPTLGPAERIEPLPLSYAQQRLWFLNRLEGHTDAYNLPFVVRISETFDRVAFQAALRDVVERHEILRTVYPDSPAGPHQQILEVADGTPALTVEATDPDAVLGRVDAAVSQGFDLTQDLPLRAHLFELGETEAVLVVVLHHIAGDGWSLQPFGRDLFAAYQARRNGTPPPWEPLPVQYADYVLWQREVLGSADDPDSVLGRQLSHWTKALAGLPPELRLPVDRPRPDTGGHRAGRVAISIDAQLHQRLTALARTSRASMFMTIQAACAVLLTRLGAGTDIPIGSPIAGRTDAALDDLVGMFVNTLVLRTDTAGDPTVRELISRVRDGDLAAYENQDVPFERLVEALQPDRSLNRNPLFQVMMTFLDTVIPSAAAEPAPAGMQAGPVPTADGGAKCDLSFSFGERFVSGEPAGIEGTLEFSHDLFDRRTGEVLVERLIRVLEAMGTGPDRHVARIDVLSAEERRLLVQEWSLLGPVPGRRCYLLDEGLNLVAPGVVGEVYVTGEPEQAAAEDWVVSPFDADGTRLIRLDQRARWRPDGLFEPVVDEQVAQDQATSRPGPGRAARTELERVLCGLFAAHLGIPAVTIDDNFFDLGGYSLLAVRLVSDLRSRLNADVTLRTLFEAPTVAMLVERIGSTQSQSSFDVLLPLRTGGDREPVFCVHPFGGLSWLYAGLARELPDDRPLYGVQARGIGDGGELPATLSEMAADYVAQIRTVQPHGPYHLLGWSLGGNIVHAMADLFEEAGEQVGLLAVLDAYPRRQQRNAEGYDEQQFLESLLQFAGVAVDEAERGLLEVGSVMAALRAAGNVLADLDEKQLRSLYRVMTNNFRIAGAPTSHHCRADMLFFAAAVEPHDDWSAWQPHVGGEIRVRPVACRHEDMMQPEFLAAIGSVITDELTSSGGSEPHE